MGCCQSQCVNEAKMPSPKQLHTLNTLLSRRHETSRKDGWEKEEIAPLIETSGGQPHFEEVPKATLPTFGGTAVLDGTHAHRDVSVEDCGESSEEDEAESKEELSYLHRIMLNKQAIIAAARAGLIFRILDTGLDVRTAAQFFARGHMWWGSLTVGFLVLSPAAQCLFVRSVSGQWRQAVPYLLPGSVQHIRKEMLLVQLAHRLSQSALYRNVHVRMSVAALTGALAGVECLFESLPQACLQAYAYFTAGGADMLNYASLITSFAGAVMGIYLGFKAVCRRAVSKAWDPEKYEFAETSHVLARGDTIMLSGLPVRPSTTAAIAWLLSQEQSIKVVDVSRSKLIDPSLKQFRHACPDLQVLNICKTGLTDDGVKTLALYCTNLQSIFLNGTKISNDGVQELVARCTELQCLDLGRLPVTDDCVHVVALHCKKLVRIDLDFTKVTDSGVNALTLSCPNLSSIDLEETSITDICVERLASQSKMMKNLLLDQTAITDSSLVALARHCASLQRVNLLATHVTSAGIQELTARCQSLRFISLSSSRLSGEHITSLRQQYPHIKFSLKD
eukprot:TRINITY_DN75500_c0_g1_i1.p1 TRINITY_DN75500_c0_g1~~TRINITY_DN75500_c0_g1_i1.p1  ORF type:complete len:563 (-),score=84.56 TRINITY_DN75500_c0_g1_i1:83-1771(-)